MSHWESATGKSDEWYTPKYIFEALEETFDLDVAAPELGGNVPSVRRITSAGDGLNASWSGFVWMNPPFGGRNGIVPWLRRFTEHGCGVALTPDRTSAPWWQTMAANADAVMFISGKVKFERPDGSVGASPSNGTTLFAMGLRGVSALERANAAGLGVAYRGAM